MNARGDDDLSQVSALAKEREDPCGELVRLVALGSRRPHGELRLRDANLDRVEASNPTSVDRRVQGAPFHPSHSSNADSEVLRHLVPCPACRGPVIAGWVAHRKISVSSHENPANAPVVAPANAPVWRGRGGDEMAKQGAGIHPGLDLRRTTANINAAIAAMLDGPSPEAVLEAHRRDHAHAPDDDRSTALRRMAGCRFCALGYAGIRVREFSTADVPGFEQAVQIKEMLKHWNAFRECTHAFEGEFPLPYEVRTAFDAIEEWQQRLIWPIEEIPAAVAELQRRVGTVPETMAGDVLELLLNGGIGWPEVINLLEDGRPARSREQRLRALLRRQRPEQSASPVGATVRSL